MSDRLTDVLDIASEIEEKSRRRAIEHASREANKPIMYAMECLNCFEPTDGGRRFCDADCQIDYSRRNR